MEPLVEQSLNSRASPESPENASSTKAALGNLRLTAKRREDWVDGAKGLCILFVVVCHAIRGLVSAGLMAPNTAWQFWDSFFYTFEVPVFFFVAGLFAERSYDKLGFAGFLRTKLAALAYPYVVWQTIQILVMLTAGRATHSAVSPVRLLEFPLFPFMQFWFLYVLMMVLAVYALFRWVKLSNAAMLAISTGMLFLPKLAWFPFNALCEHLIYFTLALVLCDRVVSIRSARPSVLLAIAIACAGVLAVIVQEPVDLNAPFRAVPAILGGAATLLVSLACERKRWWQVVCVLGRNSLEIYVAHTVFAAGARTVLLKGLHCDNLALHIGVGIAASLVGPMMLVWASQIPHGFRVPIFRTRLAP